MSPSSNTLLVVLPPRVGLLIVGVANLDPDEGRERTGVAPAVNLQVPNYQRNKQINRRFTKLK